MLAFALASTSLVESSMRGKLAGLYNAVESLGCFLGPLGFANVFAWSISPPAPDWANHRFVFYAAAFGIAVVAFLARGTITDETMMVASADGQEVDAGVHVACHGVDKKEAAGTPVAVFRSFAEADMV